MRNQNADSGQRKGVDVVVAGGGIAGLTAATLLGRAGLRVFLFEKARSVGGRGQTQAHGDFRFNIGPHALYRGGEAKRVFSRLGLRFAGGVPRATGGLGVARGGKHALPGGLVSLLTTSLLRLPDKLELARLMTALPKLDADAARGMTFRQWVEANAQRPGVRALLEALSRVATYTNAPRAMCAHMALSQIQMAFTQNVEYLDGGWQVIVDALRQAAVTAGVRVETGARVVAIEHDEAVRAVRCADGACYPTAAVIVAGAPDDAAELLPAVGSVRDWAARARPVKAACLDLALSRLPDPQSTFALGIDEPLYLSVHSAVAKLAAPGAALIHVAKYLDPTQDSDAKADERQLEGLMDLIQPGWRALLVERRFLPNLTVYNGLVSAADGGLAGRPGPRVPGVDGAYVAGDWVGPRGLLVDASVASAAAAADMLIAAGQQRQPVAA